MRTELSILIGITFIGIVTAIFIALPIIARRLGSRRRFPGDALTNISLIAGVFALTAAVVIFTYYVFITPPLILVPTPLPTPVSTPTPTPVSTPTPTPVSMLMPTPVSTLTLTPVSTPTVDISKIQTELTELQNEVATLQQRVDTVSQLTSDAATRAELEKISNDLDSLNKRLGSIEQAVLDNPTKALTLVLLNKDIENLQQRYQAELQSLREEINRMYSLNQWFLGLMVPMAISVVGLAIRSYLTKPKDKDEKKSE